MKITGYAGLSRYMASLIQDGENGAKIVGWALKTVRTSYASGFSLPVYEDEKRGRVVIAETAHRVYEVISVKNQRVFETDEQADNYALTRHTFQTA